MTTDELIEELGEDFYEVKRLVNEYAGGIHFVAYSREDRALGITVKESLENLKKLVDARIHQG